MREDDRRFYRRLLLAAGVAFVVGGFLAAFTEVGAWMVCAGIGALAAGLLLFTRLPGRAAAATGIVVTAALLVQAYAAM